MAWTMPCRTVLHFFRKLTTGKPSDIRDVAGHLTWLDGTPVVSQPWMHGIKVTIWSSPPSECMYLTTVSV